MERFVYKALLARVRLRPPPWPSRAVSMLFILLLAELVDAKANSTTVAKEPAARTCHGLTGRLFRSPLAASPILEFHGPRALVPRCEATFVIVPYIAEFFSTITALVFIWLGLVQLLCSGHSDEVVDLAASVFVLNGFSAFMSHGTNWRFFGQMDSITINVMALWFTYAVLQAYFPSLARRKIARTVILCCGMTLMVTTMVWNGHSVPHPGDWAWHSHIIVIVGVLNILFFFALNYHASKWHFGRIKRMLLLGTALMIVAVALWFIEEVGLSRSCGSRPMTFSLHPLWHLFAAMGLNMWTCVVKFHRGTFYNVRALHSHAHAQSPR